MLSTHQRWESRHSVRRTQRRRLIRGSLTAATSTLLALLCHSSQATAVVAEYAFRWDPSQGGPNTPQATMDLLSIQDKKPTQFNVQYIPIHRPSGLPANVEVIARERTKGGDSETSYKLRADVDLSSAAPTNKFPCILRGTQGIALEAEMDISWAATSQGNPKPKVKYSRTCSIAAPFKDAIEEAAITNAPDSGCAARMSRYKQNGLKFEVWTMPSGQTLFEVSRKVEADSPQERAQFLATIVQPLLKAKAMPSTDNKTELSKCP